jgi:uncharacterized protein YqeY
MRSRLRTALITAMRTRDSVAVSALRSALAAIDNAEAVDAGTSGGDVGAHPLGPVGPAEAPRRELTEADIVETVRTEVSDRLRTAGEYERLGQPEHAERLRGEATVLSRFVPAPERNERAHCG